MFPVDRALLIINRASGTGQGESTVEQLSSLFKQTLRELSDVRVELVTDHAAARNCAAQFISSSAAPAFVVAGGGGGTLRALIEAICDSGASTVRAGALRMGSGNVVARQFGVPRDPFLGLQGLLVNLQTGSTASCCVMRCETWTSSGKSEIHYAVTMGGLGQFGRIPSDLSRWHMRFPIVRKLGARSIGLERFNNLEYVTAFLLRSLTHRAEKIEIRFRDQHVFLLSLRGSRHFRIEKDQPFEIRFVDREPVEFFLDEDPVTTCGRLSLGVAGSVAFVPGPDYQNRSY
jgi:diacylglycerol kinase family enzyme